MSSGELIALTAGLELPKAANAARFAATAAVARQLRLRLAREHVRVTEAVAALEGEASEGDDDEEDLDKRLREGGDDASDVVRHAPRHKQRFEGDPSRLRRRDFMTLCELDIARTVVIPGLIIHGATAVAAETSYLIEMLKLLVALTMPIPRGSADIDKQTDHLRALRHAVQGDDFLAFLVSIAAPIASSRLHDVMPKASANLIEVTLTIYVNMLKVPPEEAESVIGALCRSHSVELMLVILQQNNAKLEEALADELGEDKPPADEGGLMGAEGDAEIRDQALIAAEATSALVKSLRLNSEAVSAHLQDALGRSAGRRSGGAASEPHLPFPVSPAASRSHAQPSPGASAPHEGGASDSADVMEEFTQQLMSSPFKSPHKSRPSIAQVQMRTASPFAKPGPSESAPRPPPMLMDSDSDTSSVMGLDISSPAASGSAPPLFASDLPSIAMSAPLFAMYTQAPHPSASESVAAPSSLGAPSPAPYTPVASATRPDSDDDDNAPNDETQKPGNESDTEKRNSESADGSNQDDDEEEEEEGEEANEDDDDDDDESIDSGDDEFVVREKDLRRDAVLAKMYADQQKRVRGESVQVLKRWNLVLLEATSLIFRAAPTASLATLGFDLSTKGSADEAAKRAIAAKLTSQKDEQARWREAIKRRHGAVTSSALLVQRAPPSEGDSSSRVVSVGNATSALTAKSQLDAVQETDLRKKRRFRRALLQSEVHDAPFMRMPFPTQIQLAQQYRLFAQFGFGNLSRMLWPELHRKVEELDESMAAAKEARQYQSENLEGPLVDALVTTELGDVLNYAALSATMLRFSRTTLRLKLASLTPEQREFSTTTPDATASAAASLVDHATLPVAAELLTPSRLQSSIRLLSTMCNKKLCRRYDPIIVVNYVAELLRMLVHSADGDLASSEHVRLAATSLAATVAYDRSVVNTIRRAVATHVQAAKANERSVEACVRLLYAFVLLLDRVSYNGVVAVAKRKVNRKTVGHDLGEEIGNENITATLEDDATQTQAPPIAMDDGLNDTVTDAPQAPQDDAGPSTPTDQMVPSFHFPTDGGDEEATAEEHESTAVPHLVDPDATQVPQQEMDEPLSDPLAPPPDSEMSIRGIYEDLAERAVLPTFFHALRLWRQLADDVIEGIVHFLVMFRDYAPRAQYGFFSVQPLMAFADIGRNRRDAPPALFNIALQYLRDFWSVSTTLEAHLRCLRCIITSEPLTYTLREDYTTDPVAKAVLDDKLRVTGILKVPDFVDEEPSGDENTGRRPKRGRRNRRTRTRVDDDDDAELENVDDDAGGDDDENYYDRHGDRPTDEAHAAMRAAASRAVERMRKGKKSAADGDDDDGPHAGKKKKEKKEKKSKKHRVPKALTTALREESDARAEMEAAGEGEGNGETDADAALRKELKLLRKYQKKEEKKQRKLAKKEAKRARKEAKRAAIAAGAAADFTQTQRTEQSSSSSSDDDGDEDATQTQQHGGTSDLASFVASPEAPVAPVAAAAIRSAIFDDDD